MPLGSKRGGLRSSGFLPVQATGGIEKSISVGGQSYKIHEFKTVGTNTFTVSSGGEMDILMVGGGGAGGGDMGAGGGAGGVIHTLDSSNPLNISSGEYSIYVGNGGIGTTDPVPDSGEDTTAFGLTALGGGGGHDLAQDRSSNILTGEAGGSGGGSGGLDSENLPQNGGDTLQPNSASGGYGYPGGGASGEYDCAGGGGAGGPGQDASGNNGNGGDGIQVNIDGNNYYWAAGGGGSDYNGNLGGDGGLGGGGGGSTRGASVGSGGTGSINPGNDGVSTEDSPGGDAGDNTGSGGGGGSWGFDDSGTVRGGHGGSGIVIVRYPI